ncbi:VOC family protein [Varunaivibrio sulfuroxidans]|uniref:VOC domain-containing protein n=1 Tax=Varunaivibrio sulfuroxidans TaxID=1773489 RepID=A0A4R3JCN3_9PROT|nr:VOC family protein [Varunaivibrio sulfuroxidans]TCS62936.1 hypothetical protein EDD55_10425 [Varunaivibrio sulfuroxidans]WES31988.1 VOC family protein [Varunaivibrio sulfuroxidans]
MPDTPPFHLAFPVHDLDLARRFYVGVLGCGVGRENSHWIDFDFWGHQVVAHLTEGGPGDVAENPVDGHQVPSRHFGVVLGWDDWHRLADKLKAAELTFIVAPYIRFQGKVGEQATMFVRDPSGNALEFKSFKNGDQMFAK